MLLLRLFCFLVLIEGSRQHFNNWCVEHDVAMQSDGKTRWFNCAKRMTCANEVCNAIVGTCNRAFTSESMKAIDPQHIVGTVRRPGRPGRTQRQIELHPLDLGGGTDS
ncbi:hypothetical protein O181_007213 [Austropuccinia psidii MF-1]|uniref:Secreted protein n=1 Tax=Austropuccinia psidii MF-1 TaxID=1389203 RepID=A0A9Q3GHC3_9BASI|nr:hypothetical protein [Austropuccinia psidii MF-1]